MNKEKISIKNIGMGKMVVIVACGIVLLLCSASSGTKKEKNEETTNISYEYDTDEYEKNIENRLKLILEKVEGVGAVEVMVTVKSTSKKVVLTEQPYSKSILNETDSQGGQRTSEDVSNDEHTVYVTDEDGNTLPYVVNEVMPEIEGVAIIAKGGDLPETKEKIINVVKSLFDIEANKISISKMK